METGYGLPAPGQGMIYVGLDHRVEPAVPLPRRRHRRGDDGLRRLASCGTCRWTSSPSSRRPRWRSRPRASGMTATEVEELVTDPARGGVQRDAGRRRPCAPSRCRRCRRSCLHLQARDRPAAWRGSWCRSAWRSRSRELPTVGRPPCMLQPLSSTSRVMKIGISSKKHDLMRPVDDRLLDDQVPAAARCPAWPTSPSGASGSRRCRYRSIRSADARARRHARRGDGGRPRTPWTSGCCRTAPNAKTRTGGFIDTPNQRFVIQHVIAGGHARGSGRGAGQPRTSRTARSPLLGDVASVVWDTGR